MIRCRWTIAASLVLLTPGRGIAQADSAGATPGDTTPMPRLTSETVITGDVLRTMPVDDPRQALMLVPGVVLRGGDIGIGIAPQLAIRGSRLGGASVYVDGAPVRFATFGSQAMALGTLGIDHVTVTTGVPGASVADAGGGGVISYVTPAGGRRLAATWRAETDEPFGDGSTVGYNRFEGAVGGPVPGVERFTWSLSGTLQGQRSHYYGRGGADQPAYVLGNLDTLVQWTDGSGTTFTVPVPQYVQWTGSCSGNNYGFECQGLRRPMDWSTLQRGQAKLSYGYGTGSSVSFTGILFDVQQRAFPGVNIADAALYPGGRGTSRLGVLNWNHALGALRGGPLTLSINLSLARDRLIDGPLSSASELTTRHPELGIEFTTLELTGADSFPLPLTDQLIRNIRSNTGLRVPYIDRLDLANTQPYRLNPYGLAAGWPTGGLDATLTLASEKRLNGRVQLDWQVDRRHVITAGADGERTDLSLYQGNLITLLGLNEVLVHPRRYALFAGDRVALGALVVDVGARYDHFTPGGDFPTTPGFISSHPDWNPTAATDDTAYTNSVARVFARGKGQSLVSPRLRAAYAVSPGTSVRAGYGRQVELPAIADVLTNTNSDLSFTSTLSPFGRDVDYAASELMELGAWHAFGSGLSLDVSVYRKNHLAPYAFRIERFANPRQPSETLSIDVLTKVDGGHGTGVDARLDWQLGSVLSGSVSYSFLRARASDEAANVTTHAFYAVAGLNVPDGWKAGTALGTIARDVHALATFRLASGLPYTLLVNNGDGQIVPQLGAGAGGLAAGQVDASQLPTTKTVDLRLTKGFRLDGRDLRAYADFRNLFNFTNVVALYAETGTVTNDAFKNALLGPEQASLAAEAQAAGALLGDGTVDLSGNCTSWGSPVNCVALRRVETRFGDGDQLYTPAEQARVLDTYYNSFFGPWRFHGPARTVRVGVEIGF